MPSLGPEFAKWYWIPFEAQSTWYQQSIGKLDIFRQSKIYNYLTQILVLELTGNKKDGEKVRIKWINLEVLVLDFAKWYWVPSDSWLTSNKKEREKDGEKVDKFGSSHSGDHHPARYLPPPLSLSFSIRPQSTFFWKFQCTVLNEENKRLKGDVGMQNFGHDTLTFVCAEDAIEQQWACSESGNCSKVGASLEIVQG